MKWFVRFVAKYPWCIVALIVVVFILAFWE